MAAAQTDKGVHLVRRGDEATFVSYAALAERAREVAAALHGLGAAPGERVALLLRNSAEFYHGLFGVLMAGATPVIIPPPPRLGLPAAYRERTLGMLRRAGASRALTHKALCAKLGPDLAAGGVACWAIEALDDEPATALTLADTPALIQFSSGSTAAPHPVELSHAQVLANVDTILAATRPDDGGAPVGVCWLPLHHDMGLIGCLLGGVRAPGDLVLLTPETFVLDPASWLRCISRWRASISPAPDFGYRLAVERIPEVELAGLDLSRWGHALNGGERVSATTVRDFVGRFAACGLAPEALRPVYGMAEATLAVAFSPRGQLARIERFNARRLAQGWAKPDIAGAPLVACGAPLPGVQVRIVRDGVIVGERRVGAIEIAGPSVAAPTPETHSRFRDGWFDSGDIGFFHEGQLYICGRSKDVIVIRGRKFAAEEIEAVAEAELACHGGCAAIPILDAETEAAAILIERSETPWPEAEAAARVRRRINDVLGLASARVIFVDRGALPRTTSGKLRRTDCRRLEALGPFSG